MKHKTTTARLLLCCVFTTVALLASRNASRAALTTYSTLASWTAAAGSPIVVEDFADSTLLPGFTITFGQNSPPGQISGGKYNDVGVTQFNDAKNPKLNFAGGTYVFGADWDFSPGGPGDGLVLVLTFTDSSTTTLFIGNPSGGTFNGFFGFVSDVAVTSIRLDSPGTGVEAFAMDNARFRIGVGQLSFDDALDGTMIDTRYAGVTFANPIGGDIYARYGSGFAPSPSNVVSVFASGLPYFDAYYGAVDAHLATPVSVVKIDVRPVAPFEFLGSLTKRPFLQAFDINNNLLGTVYYAGALPTGSGEVGPTETLTLTSPANNIAVARFSSQNRDTPPAAPPTYGLFDNFRFGQPTLAMRRQASQIVLSWSKDATGWVLASVTSLTPPVNWQPWAGTLTTNAGLISASVPTTTGSRFFRLRGS
jgi:hypothetical protein